MVEHKILLVDDDRDLLEMLCSIFRRAGYSAEDRIFYGTILGISDMVEFQSENAKDLEDEFHQAVDEYLEFCKENGKDPQKE